mgnify:CR=1 FL=1
MADKTVKELADMVGKTASAVKQQLVDAGLPARAEDDLVTELEQEKLVTYLSKVMVSKKSAVLVLNQRRQVRHV